MRNIYDYTLQELEDYFLVHNEKKFRAQQVYEFLYKKRIKSFDRMNNLGKKTIELLEKTCSFDRIKLVLKQEDKDVKKYLFELFDGQRIEAVLMHHNYGNSICVSSQVGCNMGCTFCESGRLKKIRNLEAYEMVEQLLYIEEDINCRISHVVVMGIGEPFDNYDNVMHAIRIINNQKGLNIGARHISVSTSGLVPRIYDFANEDLQCTLSISLHATDNTKRSAMMPVNNLYSIEELMEACKYYIAKTNKRISFEYALAKDNNDNLEDAQRLVDLLKAVMIIL